MSRRRSNTGSVVLVTTTLGLGPFPGATTMFVDVDNTSGIEDGSRAHPFNTLREGR